MRFLFSLPLLALILTAGAAPANATIIHDNAAWRDFDGRDRSSMAFSLNDRRDGRDESRQRDRNDWSRDFDRDFVRSLASFPDSRHRHGHSFHPIVFHGHRGHHGHFGPPASVPLPAALPLFGLGLAGLAIVRRVRRRD